MNVPLTDDNLYVHALRGKTFPMAHNKNNSIDGIIGANRNLIFLPDRVVYKQTTK